MYELEFIERGDYSEVYALRVEVFVREQGFQVELDGLDDEAIHCLLRDGEKPVATARAFLTYGGLCHIGRVAVARDYRGKGVGAELMLRFEAELIRRGAWRFELGAQLHARGFYRRLGYREKGLIYYDEFCPHINMVKNAPARLTELEPLGALDSRLDKIEVDAEQLDYVDGLTALDANREFLRGVERGISCQQYGILYNGLLCGVVTLSLIPGTYLHPGLTGEVIYYIGRFMVDRHMQGCGIGGDALRRLIGLCLEGCLGEARAICLSCNRLNTAGIKTYEATGFQRLDLEYEEDIYKYEMR